MNKCAFCQKSDPTGSSDGWKCNVIKRVDHDYYCKDAIEAMRECIRVMANGNSVGQKE